MKDGEMDTRAGTPATLAGAARQALRSALGVEAAGVAVAPGRVNLIGDHTDYNGGFVLPMAIDRYVVAAFRPRADRVVRAHAVSFGETREASLDALDAARGAGWLSYVAGAAWAMQEAGVALRGIDLALVSTVPVGAGLSSSAAIELGVARALAAASGAAWDPVRMALTAQRAENDFVGMKCGIMDQYVIACARDGAALLLDCRALEATPVPLPAGVAFVVIDTGAPRSLVGSEYNDRRASCERAVETLRAIAPGITSLRDVDAALLEAGASRLDPVTYRRARHAVSENVRPVAFADALARGDLELAGRLMDASHASLRDDYEVSSRELDLVTDLARRHPGCLGARLTGAGFGGCAVALVREPEVASFVATTRTAYVEQTGLKRSAFYTCRPVEGTHLLEDGAPTA